MVIHAYMYVVTFTVYSNPYILRPPVRSENCGQILKVVLKCRDISAYILKIQVMPLMGSLKIEASPKIKES